MQNKSYHASTLDQIISLAEESFNLRRMNITIENMAIDSDALPYFDKIFVPGLPSSLHINNCSIIDEDDQLISSITGWSCDIGTDLSITNCNLTPTQGFYIIESISEGKMIKIDLSNNKLSGENKELFLDRIARKINYGFFFISSLNLSGNGFTKEDISYFYRKTNNTFQKETIIFENSSD